MQNIFISRTKINVTFYFKEFYKVYSEKEAVNTYHIFNSPKLFE